MRKLTLEILAGQPEADWIWKSHSELSFMYGIKVVGISEGHASITAGEADAPHCDLLKYHGEFKSLGYNECPDCGAPLT